jgi:hypothetical protein
MGAVERTEIIEANILPTPCPSQEGNLRKAVLDMF